MGRMRMMGHCGTCGSNPVDMVYCDDQMWYCKECLFNAVVAGKTVAGGETRTCSNCTGDIPYSESAYCDDCAVNKCDFCDADSTVCCADCAPGEFGSGYSECQNCSNGAEYCDSCAEERYSALCGECDNPLDTCSICKPDSSTVASYGEAGEVIIDGVMIAW